MKMRDAIREGLLILAAIVLLAALTWRPDKPAAHSRKPSAAVARPAMKTPEVPQEPAAPARAKAVHPKIAVAEAAAHTRRIVVSLEDRRLALIEDGQVMQTYSVAVGKDSTPSPTGTFTIVERVENPTYYHAGKIVPPGPGNPVGTRWMGLSEAGYGIHGTNAPRSIGKAASHGCIRMARPDLEKLFAEVRTGDKVEIVGARDEETVALFGAPTNPAAPAAMPVVLATAVPSTAPAAADSSASSIASTAVVAAAIPVGQ